MDLDEEIKSREEGEIVSESREKGDLLPCSSPSGKTIERNDQTTKKRTPVSMCYFCNLKKQLKDDQFAGQLSHFGKR